MMLNLRRSAARYEIFCPLFGGDLAHSRSSGWFAGCRLTRIDIPFNAPTHIAGAFDDEQREPFVDRPSLAFLAQCVSVATVCYRVETNDCVTSDLGPLQAAMRVALEIATLHSGVIVDCTTGLGYVAARFARLCAKAGSWQHQAARHGPRRGAARRWLCPAAHARHGEVRRARDLARAPRNRARRARTRLALRASVSLRHRHEPAARR